MLKLALLDDTDDFPGLALLAVLFVIKEPGVASLTKWMCLPVKA